MSKAEYNAKNEALNKANAAAERAGDLAELAMARRESQERVHVMAAIVRAAYQATR